MSRFAKLRKLRRKRISTANHKLRRRRILTAEHKLRRIRNSILIYKLKKNRTLTLIYISYFIEYYRLILSLIQNRSSSRKRTVFQKFNDNVEKDIAEAERSPNNNNRIVIRRVK
jgi:hypothetical protein